MREILFRGKTKSGSWAEGNLLVYPDVNRMYIQTGDYFKGGAVEVKRASVGQYTGLKDKNGKKIFEGDILGSRYDDIFPDHVTFEVVEWAQNAWCLRYQTCDPDVIPDEDVLPYSEVIGNIHDNPALLEGGVK